MPEVTKEFDVDRPVDDTWEFFLAPEKVAPCVPGCESFEEIEEDVFDAEVQVSIAYTTLTFDTHVELSNLEPPEFAVVEATAEPMGRMPGSATVDGTLDLWDDDGGTAGEIGIEFAIRGRLGSLGESAFKHKSEQLTEQFLENVTEELEQVEAIGE